MSDSEEEHEHDETVKLDPEERKSIVREVIDAVKDIVKAPEAVTEEATEEPTEEKVKEPTTIREIEADAESAVREALKKVTAEEEHAKQHETLKKEIERPPIQYGKMTRALWGER